MFRLDHGLALVSDYFCTLFFKEETVGLIWVSPMGGVFGALQAVHLFSFVCPFKAPVSSIHWIEW